MDIFNNITFEYPYAFVFLIIYFICIYFCKQKSQSLYFSNTKLLKSVTKNQGLLIKILRFLIVLSIIIAIASPIKTNEVIIDQNKGYEISIILDTSGSMLESNKFKITKEILSDYIKKRKTDRLALSIFADFAYVAVPLTYDKKSLLNLLEHVEVGIAGKSRTSLYEALFLSSNLFENSKSKHKIAILLTDGMNNVDTIPLEVAISRANKYGIKVYTVGIGNSHDYNINVLDQIANETGAKSFEANSVEMLQKIYDTIDKLEKSDIKIQKYIKKEYFYQYPLDIAIGLLFLLILLNRRYS